MSKTQPNTLNHLTQLLAKLEKSGEAHTEPGSIGGETSHPSGKVEDQAETAQTGARASEYTSDIKKDQGEMGVENAGDPPGPQEGEQEKIGPVDSKSTGTDPANETSSVKGDKEDPGTSHPATTEDGEKYGSAIAQLDKLTRSIESMGREILLHYHKEASQQPGQAPAAKPAAPAKQAAATATPTAEVSEEAVKAAQAGYDLANVLADVDMPIQDKQACDHTVFNHVRQVISRADYAATKVAEMLLGQLQKQAEEEEGGEGHEEEGGGGGEEGQEGGGGAPPGAAAPGGEPALGDQGMPSEEELLQMLMGGGGGEGGAGGDMGGGGMGGAMGGGGMGGGDMGGGGGGDMAALQAALGGGGAGGPGGGAGGEDAAILQQILQELNVSPDQAQAKVAAAIAKRQNRRKQAMAKMLKDLLRG